MDYEELMLLIKRRRSIRCFSEQAVSREDLLRLVEAARWAPSNHNRQPWKFLVVRDKRRMDELAETVRAGLAARFQILPAMAAEYATEMIQYATFFAGAPALVVVLHKIPISASLVLLQDTSNPDLVSGEPLSAAMAVQNMLLAAETLGLATCVLTGPLLEEKALARSLALPAGYRFNCFIAVGYAGEQPAAPRRKSVEQIVEFQD